MDSETIKKAIEQEPERYVVEYLDSEPVSVADKNTGIVYFKEAGLWYVV